MALTKQPVMDKACFWAAYSNWNKAVIDKAACDEQSLFLGLLTQTGTKLALTKQPVMDTFFSFWACLLNLVQSWR